MTRSTRVLVRSSTFISSQVFHAGLLLLLFCLALPSCQQATEEVYPWQSGYRLGENLSRPKFEAIPTWFRVWAWTTPKGMEALYEQNFKGTLREWVEESRRQELDTKAFLKERIAELSKEMAPGYKAWFPAWHPDDYGLLTIANLVNNYYEYGTQAKRPLSFDELLDFKISDCSEIALMTAHLAQLSYDHAFVVNWDTTIGKHTVVLSNNTIIDAQSNLLLKANPLQLKKMARDTAGDLLFELVEKGALVHGVNFLMSDGVRDRSLERNLDGGAALYYSWYYYHALANGEGFFRLVPLKDFGFLL